VFEKEKFRRGYHAGGHLAATWRNSYHVRQIAEKPMLDLIPFGLGAAIVVLIFVGVELSAIKEELKNVNENLDTMHDVLAEIRDNTNKEIDD
jgi:hypothetical protein